MDSPELAKRASLIIEMWLPCYPRVTPWVDAAARAELRRSEDDWLDTFSGLATVTLPQLHELITWKWQGYPAKRSQSRKGAEADWHHARRCIETALAEPDPGTAIDVLIGHSDGIPNWHTAMASALLAACHPGSYTVADSRDLKTMMLLEGKPDSAIAKIRQFPRNRWEEYLTACHEIAGQLGIRLRDIDRAFWACAGQRGISS